MSILDRIVAWARATRSWMEVFAENDELKAENERLKEALRIIVDATNKDRKYFDRECRRRFDGIEAIAQAGLGCKDLITTMVIQITHGGIPAEIVYPEDSP